MVRKGGALGAQARPFNPQTGLAVISELLELLVPPPTPQWCSDILSLLGSSLHSPHLLANVSLLRNTPGPPSMVLATSLNPHRKPLE